MTSCRALAAGLLASSSAFAAAAVVVGDHDIPRAEVERGIAACNQAGRSDDLARCLRDDVSWRWLLDERARELDLRKAQSGAAIERQELYLGLTRQVAAATNPASDEEVAKARKKHGRDFDKPLRIRVFRILVASEDEAKSLIEAFGPDTTPEEFRQKARAVSLDKATHQRGGDLGFVWPDGTTDVPQLRAEASLYEAALSVKDGKIVPHPVAEKDRFAVVWRRGSLAEAHADDVRVARLLRQRLAAEKTEAALDALVEEGAKTVERHDDMLNRFKRPECKLFTR